MPEAELMEKNITIKKGKDIVIEPGLTLYRIGDAILLTSPSEWGTEDEGFLPQIDIFPLEGECWEHKLEQWVKVLDEILWTMGPSYNKIEEKHISIVIKEKEK